MRKFFCFFLVALSINAQGQTHTFISIDSLVQIGRYKKALTILKEQPSTFTTNLKIASIYNAVDAHKKAATFYKKALVFKSDYQTKIKLGNSYRKEQKLKEAIAVFEAVSMQDSDNLLVKYQLGKLYLQTKKGENAKNIFKELIVNDPKNSNYSYKLGLAYTLLKKRNLKINNFLNAFKKDETHFKAIQKLAMAFTLLRDKDSAAIFIEKGLKLNPYHIELNKLRVNNLYRKKEYTKALVVLKRIDSIEPNDHYTQKMLGKSYYNLKQYKEAIVHFNNATKLDREDFKAHIYLGDIKLLQEDEKAALLYYSMATYVGKKSRDKAYLGLAKVFYKQKKPKLVLKNYKKAVLENRFNSNASYLLAKFSDDYYKEKKIAYDLYKKYIKRFGGKNTEIDKFITIRIATIKKDYFLKGITLE